MSLNRRQFLKLIPAAVIAAKVGWGPVQKLARNRSYAETLQSYGPIAYWPLDVDEAETTPSSVEGTVMAWANVYCGEFAHCAVWHRILPLDEINSLAEVKPANIDGWQCYAWSWGLLADLGG